MNFGIPTNVGVEEHVEETHGQESWRYKVMKVMHSKTVQYTLMGLLMLDVIILFVEVFLFASYPMCSLIERDGISCCPDSGDHRFLSEEGICPAGTKDSGHAYCDDHKWERVHKVEEFLFVLTIFILSLFFVELNIIMVTLRPRIFFRQAFLLLDYVIVSVSLTLESVFHALSEPQIQSLVGLLIVARMWRFIRIAHGIVEVVAEISHTKYQDLLTYTEELEELLKANNVNVPDTPSIRRLKLVSESIVSEIEREHRKHHYKHTMSDVAEELEEDSMSEEAKI